MFFYKPIYKQIKEYGRNTEFLRIVAKLTRIERIQDIDREKLKLAYTELVEPMASLYFRLEHVKYINKFMRHYGVPFVLRTEEVLEITPNDAIVEAMKTISKFNPTPKRERNKLIVKLKDQGWSFSEICAEVGLRSKSNVHDIYWREKKRSGLSTV